MAQSETYDSMQMPGKDAEEQLKNLKEEKNSLLKIISHDLRAPFNQIFALMQLIEMEPEKISPKHQEYIDKMYLAVIGGMEMIKNLHDSRAIDNGNITLNFQKVNIKPLLRQSVKNFSVLARLKNINIEVNEAGPDHEISVDRILLLKILDCVMSNSVKFSEKNSKVEINTEKENDHVRIKVRDHGPGLADEEIPLIFGKYQKLSARPTIGEGTTGLGMYLSLVFIRMMNGELKVGNHPDGGLEVTIKI